MTAHALVSLRISCWLWSLSAHCAWSSEHNWPRPGGRTRHVPLWNNICFSILHSTVPSRFSLNGLALTDQPGSAPDRLSGALKCGADGVWIGSYRCEGNFASFFFLCHRNFLFRRSCFQSDWSWSGCRCGHHCWCSCLGSSSYNPWRVDFRKNVNKSSIRPHGTRKSKSCKRAQNSTSREWLWIPWVLAHSHLYFARAFTTSRLLGRPAGQSIPDSLQMILDFSQTSGESHVRKFCNPIRRRTYQCPNNYCSNFFSGF